MENKNVKPFGFKDKLAYMMGDVGCNMSFALNSYLMLFYTQYIGLSMETWAVIILCLKVWDAINDPIMGGLMDSLKPGKRGKFKTYIFYGSFILVVSGALCFLPIQNAPYAIKALVAVLGYLVWDMSYTLVNVPYGAMNSVITADSTERAQLSTWRSLGSLVANLVVAIILPLICFDANSNLIGSRMFTVALIMGFAGLAAFQILLRGTTERVKVEEPKADQPKEGYNYFRALAGFFKNRAAVAATLVAMVILLLMNAMQSATQIVYQTFFQNAQISGLISMITMLPMILCMPLITPLVKKFGKKEASTWPLLVGVVAGLGMAVLPIHPDGTGLAIWIVLTLLVNISYSVYTMVSWAMVADCIDYQEIQTGRREEGTVYATYSLGRKLAQGFGASLIAILLTFTGYVATDGAVQADGVANNIRMLVGWMYCGGLGIMFLLQQFVYNLDKKTVAEISRKLGRSNEDKIGTQADED